MASATVAVISASFGSGHDVAARELARRLRARDVATQVHDFVDLLGPALGPVARSMYARQLTFAPATWGWALQLLGHPSAVRRCAGICSQITRDRMTQALADVDAVVSTYPLASLVLGDLRRRGDLAVPVVTVFTDLSVHPLWVSPDVDLHLAPHALAAAQGQAAGAATVELIAPAVDSQRFRPLNNRAEVRRRYGLPADARLALISSGAWGVGAVSAIARDVARTGQAIPVIACARNDALRHRLARRGYGPAIGWTDDMPGLIGACDVVVTNAGGLTGLEAIACGVPLIAYRPLPGHGAANAEVMHETGLGVYARDTEELAKYLANPWPAAFSQYSVGHPREIFGYAEPVTSILGLLGQPAALADAA